jgi:hypothetical protein
VKYAGICLHCDGRNGLDRHYAKVALIQFHGATMADQPPTKEDLKDLIEAAQEARKEFEAYDGDEYFIRNWVDDETSFETAVAELGDPFILSVILNMNGLECILADKHATAGLKKLLIQRHPGILAELAVYAKRRKPKGKPGPRPKDGKFIYQEIAELDAQGLSDGKIAIIRYGTAAKRNLVAAHRNQARNKKYKTRPAEQRPSNK